MFLPDSDIVALTDLYAERENLMDEWQYAMRERMLGDARKIAHQLRVNTAEIKCAEAGLPVGADRANA